MILSTKFSGWGISSMTTTNPSGYQVVINGQPHPIEALTREELISELISAIDKLEDIDDINCQLAEKIRDWRRGK